MNMLLQVLHASQEEWPCLVFPAEGDAVAGLLGHPPQLQPDVSCPQHKVTRNFFLFLQNNSVK